MLHVITIASFVFFTALVAVSTWLIVRHKETQSRDSFFLAGRSLTFPFIAGSLLLTNLSTEQMVGLNGSAFAEGFPVMAWEVVAVVALTAMAWFFLPKFLRAGVTTVPEYLSLRFDRTTGTICNIIFMLAYTFGLLPIVLYTGAVGLGGIFDLRELTGIADERILLVLTVGFVGIAGAIYALFGGLRSVAVSDLLNGIGLLIGGFMICFFALAAAGGGAGILAGLKNVYHAAPEKFNSIGSSTCSVPFHTVFSGVLVIHLFYWCTNQQIIQRTFGAKSLAEGQKGVLLCGALKLLGPLYLVLPGVIAYSFFKDAGIKPDASYGMLVHKVLPAPLTGFFAAVMVGAILSSFNSALNSTCTLFSIGIYKEFINKDADDRQVIASGKIFGWIVAVLAMLVAPFLANADSIFTYLQLLNSVYFIPIFAVVVLGMYTRKVPAAAANTALIGGCAATLTGVLLPDGILKISPFHYAAIVFLALVALLIFSAFISPRPKTVPAKNPVEMTPWEGTIPCGILLLLAVAASYLVLAKF
ncbi:MAG: solute:sodium symporter family transporter [Victivallaceae bacterium]|nr:solute:sodium symporter family transporter [Victivallaceae bacterium]